MLYFSDTAWNITKNKIAFAIASLVRLANDFFQRVNNKVSIESMKSFLEIFFMNPIKPLKHQLGISHLMKPTISWALLRTLQIVK